jgi:prepilin-type N-terminal cleavage/methylation domain-containing protein
MMNDSQQKGFTLIELLVATTVSLIALAIAGGILISGLRTQETAVTVTDAANTAQQIVRSVQSGVRNASAVSVSSPSVGSQLLLARSIGSDPNSTTPSCQAWYYTSTNGGSVYTTKTTPASLITLPAGGPQGVWSFLGTGVSPSDPVTGKVFNAPSGGRVELRFDVAAGTHPYVLVNTMTYTPQAATVSAPCF